MSVTLYTFVNMYEHALAGLDHLLDKGVDFAASHAISSTAFFPIGPFRHLAFPLVPRLA